MEILLQGLRVAFSFCLYFLTLACYLAPILVVKCWGSRTLTITSPDRAIRSKYLGLRVISYCNCFAAGIFLAITFLLLLPYSNEKLQLALTNHEFTLKFPASECVVVLGFLFTLLVEQTVLAWKERTDAFVQKRDDVEQGQGLLEECEMQDLSDDPSALIQDENVESFIGESITSHQHQTYIQDSYMSATNTNMTSNDMEVVHSCSRVSLISRENVFLFYILAIACALHSIFEGISLGLQVDIPKAVHLFIAIIFHECLISGALGVISLRLHLSFMSYLRFATIFSTSIPVGLIIGIILEKVPSSGRDFLSGTFQGLIGGVFLHVVFQDIFPAQFINKEHRIPKVLFVSLGFITITAVTYLVSKL